MNGKTHAALSAVVVLAVAASATAADPHPLEKEHEAALADARRLGPLAAGVKYFTTYNIVNPVLQTEHRQAGDFWVNSLSVEAEIARMRQVTPTLYAVSRFAYGWDEKRFDALALEDPYFHVKLKTAAGGAGRAYFAAEPGSKAGWYEAKFTEAKTVAAIAPWLPPTDAAELVALTATAAPILRLDWFLSRVAAQAGRKGTGYYDFLGIKSRDTYERLIGLNVKESQRVKREVAGIVARSGVANFPRQIFRFQSITGGAWQTRDILDDNQDARNPLRNLDGDYKHQAEEWFGSLSNGLFAYGLFDDKGVIQETAPDKIGSDKTSPGNDPRIHAGIGCARCHIEGLRPIKDWSRSVFKGPLQLNSPDPDKARRIQQIYFGELQEKLTDDVSAFSKVLKRTTGLTPEANAKVVGRVWERYVEANYYPTDVAAHLGVDEKLYLDKLRAAYKANPLADPVLAGHLAIPPVPLRADDYEQLIPLIYPTILGVKP